MLPGTGEAPGKKRQARRPGEAARLVAAEERGGGASTASPR
eukprot:COSAG01_NODE_69874_length_260_cov_0.639752_1_plen_40_part_10